MKFLFFNFSAIKFHEKNVDKCMAIWGKVSNIIKNINSELMYNKKYLKAGKD